MTIGFNEWRLSYYWSCDDRHRDCLLPEVSSQRTPGPCWEQLSADLIEISQRKHGLRPCQVLGQAAVSHFGEAPQLLDYAKGVFASRPGPRTRPVDHPPARAQRPFRGRTPIDPVAHFPTPRETLGRLPSSTPGRQRLPAPARAAGQAIG